MSKSTFFTNNPSATVSSNRILYTPSEFAKSSLMYLQEIGDLKALKEHTSERDNIQSYLFFMVMTGSGQLKYGGRNYVLSKGGCVFIDCRYPYSHMTSDDLWSLRWCHFNGPMMASIYEKYTDRGGRAVFIPKDIRAFGKVLDSLYKIAGSNDYIRDMEINEELGRLCTLLMAESWHPEEKGMRDTGKKSVVPVKEYLDAHYTEKITLDDLSRIFYINKYYLTRMFKDRFGITISSYLINIRVTHAKQMLRFTDMSIEEIGQACGLGQAHYFSRVFKAVEGVAPSIYRSKW